MTQPLCLIVSANAGAAIDWRRGLDPWGFRHHAVPHADAALGLLDQCRFDALLVDGDDERDARAAGAPAPARPLLGALPALNERAAAPILVVWSQAGDLRQIDALARGAADTVVKPASPRLVGAKLKRLVEIVRVGGRPAAPDPWAGPRAAVDEGAAESRDVVYGPLRLDAGRALATCGGRPLPLTAGEFALVELLAGRAGEVVARETIVRTLIAAAPGEGGRGRPALRDTHRSADMHVCRIRRKLEQVGARGVQLATVHGRGYAFRIDPESLRAA